ncbi:CaiB/BaiF CoA transferase family protein [Pseudomarimonas arenosa]|uniref:CoA transferase n=1 Tax=Pseudomarimonas arenosa TaxID=2774145 RepID=A0AAW3ZKF8_9GAMM|nr:CoA transferase [Pseudomarimonas arenosa]MBD8526608.1 CoA transferase [Pseudomarimonas arenosa]
MPSALDGLKVLDLSRILAGPWCSQTLADFGAQVIKVEPPEGDETRRWGPPFRGELSAYFTCANRNKQAIAIDLKDPAQAPLIEQLLNWADVLIENFRGGQERVLGFDYASLSERYPTLIVCSISGYGRHTEQSTRPGFDFVVQAEAGLMSITGAVDGEPMKVGVAVADLFCAQNATIGILAALRQRELSGRGQHVDVSLFGSQLQMLANVASNSLFSGQAAPRYGNAHPNIVPYQTFRASDDWFALAVASDKLWREFCVVIERPQLGTDARFKSNPDRVRHRDELIAQLSELFAQKPRGHWLNLLQQCNIPAAPVLNVEQALEHPLTAELGMKIELDGIPMLANPIKLSASPAQYRTPPPVLDAGRAAVERLLRGHKGTSDA